MNGALLCIFYYSEEPREFTKSQIFLYYASSSARQPMGVLLQRAPYSASLLRTTASRNVAVCSKSHRDRLGSIVNQDCLQTPPLDKPLKCCCTYVLAPKWKQTLRRVRWSVPTPHSWWSTAGHSQRSCTPAPTTAQAHSQRLRFVQGSGIVSLRAAYDMSLYVTSWFVIW